MDPRFKPIRPPGLRQKPVRVENQLVYLPIAKCGSSTFMLFFKTASKRVGSRRSQGQGVKRLVIVRHPVDRLVSAYYFAWHNKGARRLWFNEWWQIVKENPRIDMHTEPMADLFKLYGVNQKDFIFQLEQIDQWWPVMAQELPQIFDREPGRTNAAKVAKAPVEDEIRAEILEVYADDYEIWKKAAI